MLALYYVYYVLSLTEIFTQLSNCLGHTVRFLGQKKGDGKKKGGASLALPKIRKNPLIEIIAINTG